MALSTTIEEILSDDYEEGEILDEDNLYDNVSSSEEYSTEETDSNDLHSYEQNSVNDLTKESKKVKHHRKKEHKCKEDSVCRIERSGKHCYARIRKEKRDTIRHKKQVSSDQKDVLNKYLSSPPLRREEVDNFRHIPALKAPRNIPAPKLLYRNDYRDSYEKENRYGYKRYRNLPDKYTQGKNRYQGKGKPQNKGSYHLPNRSRYSIVAPPVSYISETVDKVVNSTEQDVTNGNKSSLLKRLVGSGSAGLKVTDDEKKKENEEETPKTDLEPQIPPEVVNCMKPPLEGGCSAISTSVATEAPVATVASVPNVEKKVESVVPKKIEVKWKRSIKEDKDELCLRVEALRSALVRKFRENQKKRQVGQKKTAGDFDDSLVEFVLGDESDFEVPDESEESNKKSKIKEETPSNKNGEFPKMIATDISGDVLKPEDMVIDNADKGETQFICDESAVKIDAKVAFQNANFSVTSPLYVPPNFALPFTNLDPNGGSFSVNSNQASGQNENFSVPRNGTICLPSVFTSSTQSFGNNLHKGNNENNKVDPHTSVKPLSKLKFEKQKSISPSKLRKSSEKKKKRKRKPKQRKKKKKTSTKETHCDFDDEILLREIALMSIKSKNGNSLPLSDISDYANTGVAESKSLPLSDSKNSPLSSSSTFAEPTSTLDDEFDEDILRAQALSSLGKQVSETFIDIGADGECYISIPSPSNLPSPSRIQNTLENKTLLMEKSAKKKIKTPLLKKQWKQTHNSVVIERRYRLKNKYVRGARLYVKNEATLQVHPQKPSKSVIPPIPKVAKMVISVGTDSSDESGIEDGEIQAKSDIEANIDLLLQEAQKNSQLMKTSEDGSISNEVSQNEHQTSPAEENKVIKTSSVSVEAPINSSDTEVPNEKKKSVEESNLEKSSDVNGKKTLQNHKDMTPKQNRKSSSSCSSSTCSTSTVSGATETPQVLKHLPAWQQEEYRMLKKKIAEKERVLQLARAKLIEPSVEKNIKPPVASPRITLISKEIEDCKLNVSDTESEKSVSGLVQVAPAQPSAPGGKSADSKDEIENTEVKSSSPVSGGLSASPTTSKRACDFEQAAAKKLCTGFNSGAFMDDIKNLETKVQDFDESTTEYMALKKKADRIKKILELTEKKIVFKKNRLLSAKKKIEEDEKTLSNKMSSAASPNPSQADSNKQTKRDTELSKLKFKEISLRAQVLFHNFLNDKTPEEVLKRPDPKLVSSKEASPAKSQKPSPTGIRTEPGGIQKLSQQTSDKPVKDTSDNLLKRNFSGKERDRDEWDPHKPVCHFDLNGICRDEECTYQHFKTL